MTIMRIWKIVELISEVGFDSPPPFSVFVHVP